MIILGLGSNKGNRLQYLRLAIAKIQADSAIQLQAVSPLYESDALLPEVTEAAWNLPYLNAALACCTSLSPLDLLARLKKIESDIGRKPTERWSPREIDIDILAWGEAIIDESMLQIPHPQMIERPFALWPLSDLLPDWRYPISEDLYRKTVSELIAAWGSRFEGKAPLKTRQLSRRLVPPFLMGVLNITPDSFSDGQRYLEVNQAYAGFSALRAAGSEIIDIGAISTRPGAEPISLEVEWQRLEPMLERLKAEYIVDSDLQPILSLDTFRPEILEKALSYPIQCLNDQSALSNSRVLEIVQSTPHLDVVIMHQLGLPADKNRVLDDDRDVISYLREWFSERISQLSAKGITPERLILDPGIGFGKTATQSFHVLQSMEAFKSLGCRVLVGHSRKSFLANFTAAPPKNRDIETIVVSLSLARQGVDYLRVHNVEAHRRALRLQDVLACQQL